jgi:UDPglucose 6-dehydrogenase
MLALLRRHFTELRGLRVAVLGLAFKEDTDDMRESPAIPIVRELLEQGAQVTAYDPIAADAARKVLPDGVRYVQSLEQALQQVDAALLVTRWDDFQRVPALLKGRADAPVVIDGRRVIEPGSVPRYEGVGRRALRTA